MLRIFLENVSHLACFSLFQSVQIGNENALAWWKEKEELERQYIVE